MTFAYVVLGAQTIVLILALSMVIATSKAWHWTFHTKRLGGWLKICGHCTLERLDGRR
jgi:hypothetical protein